MNKTEYEKDLFKRIVDSMKAHGLENCAESVFLTGSFGREEATYEYDGENVRLKSDVEIGVVYKSKKAALEMISEVTAEFAEELNCMTISRHRIKHLDNFNNTLIPQRKKSLFMYDLVNCNKHLWGTDFLKDAVISFDDVDLYEAKRIIANRIGELVCALDSDGAEILRWKAKLISAVGTAYLMLNGKYKCSYLDQMSEAAKIKNDLDSSIGEDFFDKYAESFAFLRQGAETFSVSDAELRSYVKNISTMFCGADFKKPKINTLSRKLKYLLKHIKNFGFHGVFNIEVDIIDSLIEDFSDANEGLLNTAKHWHDVLY